MKSHGPHSPGKIAPRRDRAGDRGTGPGEGTSVRQKHSIPEVKDSYQGMCRACEHITLWNLTGGDRDPGRSSHSVRLHPAPQWSAL